MNAELTGTLERIERKLDSLHKKVDALSKSGPEQKSAAQRVLVHCLTIRASGPPGPKRA